MVGPHQRDTGLEFWRFINDTIVERRAGRMVVAFNGHFATERVAKGTGDRAWWLSAQWPVRLNILGPWSVTIRPEVAKDTTGRWTLAEQNVFAVTSTLEYKVPYCGAGMTLRLEHRCDRSTGARGGFFDDHEVRPGEIALTPNQHLVIVAAIFTFDGSR
jgi:hypothetical protein